MALIGSAGQDAERSAIYVSGAAGTFFSRVLSRFQSPRFTGVPQEDSEKEPAAEVPPPAPILPAVPSPAPPEDEQPSPAVLPSSVPSPAQKRSRAITTATDSSVSPLASQAAQAGTAETKDPIRESVLITLEQDLLVLLNQVSFILVRVKRPPSVSGSVGAAGMRRRPTAPAPTAPAPAPAETTSAAPDNPAHGPSGTITMGRETAQKIEGRARGLLLETSLTQSQQNRIDRILQCAQDLLCALQAARYAWQIAFLLPEQDPTGLIALPRLKRVSECVVEMSSRVAFAIEGREGAAGAVAEQYRTFLAVKNETHIYLSALQESRTLSQPARRLSRAALWSMTVSAESMAKVAARFALPIEASRQASQDHEKYKHLDQGDDLLSPIRRR